MTFDGIEWSVNMQVIEISFYSFISNFHILRSFEKGFRPGHERQFEWSTSGTPVDEHSRQFAVNIFEAVNTRFKVCITFCLCFVLKFR